MVTLIVTPNVTCPMWYLTYFPILGKRGGIETTFVSMYVSAVPSSQITTFCQSPFQEGHVPTLSSPTSFNDQCLQPYYINMYSLIDYDKAHILCPRHRFC
ncbi:hypothetical protein KP509_13G023700 [Ceratopteris richardii]|uniref:Uncharacterized protein n=1 Tax=Ceratopteris richardii TaxID=49495 RepID=A0A8T2THB9_CERRI|nr:hypothetical protein KP509_13G023700 [Ceratopteris richardii]